MPRVYICPECGEKAKPSGGSVFRCNNTDEHTTALVFYFPAAHWPAAFVRDEPSSEEVEMARNPAVQRLVAKAIVEQGKQNNTHWVATTVADGKITLEIPND